MLSKIMRTCAVLVLFLIPDNAEAHNKHKPKFKPQVVHKAPKVVVTLGWVWVDATLFRPAHWHHPHYGKSHRLLLDGPPPPRPHVHAVWVKGYWQGRSGHRHWVPGHWQQEQTNGHQ